MNQQTSDTSQPMKTNDGRNRRMEDTSKFFKQIKTTFHEKQTFAHPSLIPPKWRKKQRTDNFTKWRSRRSSKKQTPSRTFILPKKPLFVSNITNTITSWIHIEKIPNISKKIFLRKKKQGDDSDLKTETIREQRIP